MVRLPPRLRPLYPAAKRGVVLATRAVAPVSRGLDRWGAGLLPVGSADTLEQAAVPDGRCVTVRAATAIRRPEHLGSPAGLRPIEPATDSVAPRVAVAELPGGRVLGRHRAVITGDGRLVDEVSRYFVTRGPAEHPLLLNPRLPEPRLVPGRVGVLACRGDANYYHFLIDALSRLDAIERAGLIESIDAWYVPTSAPFQRELLDAFDIAPGKLIDADTVPHIRAETLVVASLPAMDEVNPPWVVDFLRSRLIGAHSPVSTGARLYVTREAGSHNRAVRNGERVARQLAARGFEQIDPGTLSVADQVAAFSGAEAIISPHGAALANLVFVPPGAAVVELFPANAVLPDYWRLVTAIPEVRYRYLARPGSGRVVSRQRALVRDIDVDPADLDRVLDDLDIR